MFLGHLAVGFAAKPLLPRVSLAFLVLGVQLADTLWPVFVGLGLEQVAIDPGNTAVTPLDFISYPYSHSLAALIVWGVAFAVLYYVIAGTSRANSEAKRRLVLLFALVVSHWVLDFVSHGPDMPIYPGGARYGLGLWNSVTATVIVELLMWGAGVWLYLGATRARDRIGSWAFLALVAFLTIVYFGNVFGPPPPSVNAVWMTALVAIPLLMLWAWWVDRHRESIDGPRRSTMTGVS